MARRRAVRRARSRAACATYDAFYDALAPRLDALAERGPFVLLDVHSYNHRRDGADAPPAPAEDNPEVNVGTASIDRDRFGPLVERFMADLRDAVDRLRVRRRAGERRVRGSRRWRGGSTTATPASGCVLALEFKKTFMDEWTGEVDDEALDARADVAGGHAARPRGGAGEAAVIESGEGLSAADLAVDHQLALLAGSFRFLLDITPVDADDLRDGFLEGRDPDPAFTYRELEADPDVVRAELAAIDLGDVEDPVLGQLLRAKHREMELQLDMLEARDTEDFLPLSVELYGGVSPALRTQAEQLLAGITRTEPTDEALDAEEFLALAEAEIAHYRAEDPDLDMHAEIRADVNGVMVSGDVLLIGPETKVQRARAQALLHHEVGTHLVTQANGSHQPIKVLGVGLAGYDETQEGLAVLAEIACGGLTAFRLRQLASRVVTVHRMIGGASFAEAHEALVADDFPEGERVDDGDARLPLRRDDQGRDLPARARRAARAPRRRRHARPAVAGQVLAARPAAHRRPGGPRPAPAAAGPAQLPARPGRPTRTWRARPGPRISAHSWRDTHEDRIRRQRHRDREGGVHHQPPRHGGQGDGPRGLVHGDRRLRLRARRLAERQGPHRPRQDVPLPRAPPRRRPEARRRAADRRWTTSTW